MIDSAGQLNGCQPGGKCHLASRPALNGIGDGVEIPSKAAQPFWHILQDGVNFRLLVAVARGEMELKTAIAQAQMHTRRYAKRQMTWFRNQMPDWANFNEQDYEDNLDKIFSFISKKFCSY